MPANYVLLEKITVGSAGASSVTFASIPQTGYTDLVVKVSARSLWTGGTTDSLGLYLNGVQTNRTRIALNGNGSSAASSTSTYRDVAPTPAGLATASTFSNVEIYIPNYASANYKSFSSDAVMENNATASDVAMYAGLWSTTAAITSISFDCSTSGLNFQQYSTFYLYGVAKLGTTPAIAPKATGGDVVMTDGSYWYHAFRSSGTFTPASTLSCDVLAVAGGGGAGWDTAAGAGGGGVIASSNNSFGVTSYTITIGGGGTSPSTSNGTNGTDSTISGTSISLTAKGGGGSATNGGAGINGGSGGGGGFNLTTAGTSTQTGGYGNSGGTSSSNPGGYPTGGGGGGGAVGSNTSGNTSGAGGVGISGLIVAFVNTMGSATSTGQLVSGNYYYAGGGGGGAYGTGSGVRGLGGNGGGGNGTASPNGSAGIAGTVNTGGGGGGGAGGGGSAGGGAGGSGIVIVRYSVA